MKKQDLILPFKWKVGKYKTLSVNGYAHLHWARKSKIKEDYMASIYDQLMTLDKIEKPIELHFVMIPPNKIKRDRANILALHEKFVCDALVREGILIDDNDRFITRSVYTSGGVDKNNPRVELTILEVE